MQRIAVDVEHTGIRVVVPLLATGALLLVLWGGPLLLDALGTQESLLRSLPFPLAIVAAISVAFIGDRLLKKHWPSGRAILVDGRYLVLQERKEPDRVVQWANRANLLTWRFAVSRRSRVPRGHLCLAWQITQDETQITVYTFLDPKKLDTVPAADMFTPLAPRRSLDDERLSMRIAGQQRRLLQAENERWQGGAELLPESFLTLWEIVRERMQLQQE